MEVEDSEHDLTTRLKAGGIMDVVWHLSCASMHQQTYARGTCSTCDMYRPYQIRPPIDSMQPCMQVESYPWSGETVKHKRRDKRRGIHTGQVVRTPTGAAIE